MNLKELAKSVDMPVLKVMNVKQRFGLKEPGSYSSGYAVLIRKLTYLSTYDVPHHAIKTLLSREKSLLELLKADSLDRSSAWFENLCTQGCGVSRLLLSGYDIGKSSDVQPGLDFRRRPAELFTHHEMGADVLYALERYQEAETIVRDRMDAEIPQLAGALEWGRRILRTTKA